MTYGHDTRQGHHNPSDPQSNTSVDHKLIIGKDESFSIKAMQNEDITAIMDKLTTVEQPLDPLESSNPKSTLYWISKEVMKEAVENKKVKLKQSDKEIPTKDVVILRLIDTSYLYGLINDGINKYNDSNTTQGLINNMFDNTNTATVVDNNNKTTTSNKTKKAESVIVHENNNGAMKLAEAGMESNHTLGAHIVEENEGWFYGRADEYDVWNNYSHTSTNENEPSSSHTFMGNNSIFKLTKTKHKRKSKTRIVSEVPTSIKLDFYIGEGKK